MKNIEKLVVPPEVITTLSANFGSIMGIIKRIETLQRGGIDDARETWEAIHVAV